MYGRLLRRLVTGTWMALVVVLGAGGCARPLGSWFPGEEPDAGLCPPAVDLECTRREDGPCSRWVTVMAECSPAGVWQCPAGTQPLIYPAPAVESCLPFYEETSPFVWLGALGAPVEREDDRCMWIMSDGVTGSNERISHPAMLLPTYPESGSCVPGAELLGGGEPYSVADESELGAEVIASLGDGFLHGGRTWIFYRHWVWDPGEVFGVRLIGTRLAWYHPQTESVRFLEGFLWDAEVAFGDAAVVADGVPYVYGCHGPPVFLSQECYVARLAGNDLGDPAAYEHYAGGGQWSSDITQEAPIFESGPHRTGVRYHPGLDSYVMLFAYGFGTQVELRTAQAPEGPWIDEGVLMDCELPADDPDAFCSTPALHLELMSDWRPNEWAITYEIGSLAPDAEARRLAHPARYWPHLVRVQGP